MTRTLLVTNDFPPKLGGIQSYLGELWSRLDPSSTVVLTASSDPAAPDHDAASRARGLVVERVRARTLYLPSPATRRAVDAAVLRHRPELILYDPAIPLGLLGRRSGIPYGVVLHGAEVAIPARLPGVSGVLRQVLRGAAAVVCAGGYPEKEARRVVGDLAGVVQVPPGVDTSFYAPMDEEARRAFRSAQGVGDAEALVVSVGRLVPRKGLDVLIEAVARSEARASIVLALAGTGRDAARLRRVAESSGVRVRFLGRVGEEDKVAWLGAADLFAQPCRSRWLGLEQEGFGIAFLEAAACGAPQLAGRSGGSAEAVEDGVTGAVVDDPRDPAAVASALDRLLADRDRLAAMGRDSRARALASFDYDRLAVRLAEGLEGALAAATGPGSATPAR